MIVQEIHFKEIGLYELIIDNSNATQHENQSKLFRQK